jgi:DNA-directed RNA polymerase subunit RPC12/RpoP
VSDAAARGEAAVALACVRCGALAEGGKRVAIWEEEEKGRLGARPLPVCAACHAAFLAGEVSRVDFARAYHAAIGVQPHGWIGRIDRDLLLDVVCLNCGVLLDADFAPPTSRVTCPNCGVVNRLGTREDRRLTVEIEP